MIWGFDTENNSNGRLLVACARSRSRKLTVKPGPAHRADWVRVLMLEAQIEPVHVWSINLGYDIINFFGSEFPDFLTIQFGRRSVVGATLKGSPVTFFDCTRFIVRKNAAEIALMVGSKKIKLKVKGAEGSAERFDSLSDADLARYCMRDADIARRAGEAIENELLLCGVKL